MEPIDISNNINDFKQVFESESRIIFSAKFGDGKSYFLKKFMESYPKEANEIIEELDRLSPNECFDKY